MPRRGSAVEAASAEKQDLAVGISDLLAHRECPRRAAYGARRHTGEGEQSPHAMTPEADSPPTAFGSCVHDAIELIEDGWDDDAAVEQAWRTWGSILGPADLKAVRENVIKFHERDFGAVRTVLAEDEVKVLLCIRADGVRIFFRAKIDRLYERLDRPGSFIHVDYKTSKYEKSQDEVDEDPQLWAYNWVLHEYLPEIEDLSQCLDQLRHGQVFTSKTDEQRAEIKDWLVLAALDYFDEHELMQDGLPAPRLNKWCPWCVIATSCPIIPQLSDWARTEIKALNPQSHIEAATPIDEYVAHYEKAKLAQHVLEKFIKDVGGTVKELTHEERDRLGFALVERRHSVYGADRLAQLAERLGPRFFELASISKRQLEKLDDPELRDWALGLAEKTAGTAYVQKKKASAQA